MSLSLRLRRMKISTTYFKTEFATEIFRQKYQMNKDETWAERCRIIVNDVCGDRTLTAKPHTYHIMSKTDRDQLVQYMVDMKFIPGGRYVYYAGRPAGFFNNCFCLKAEEDTREEWAAIAQRATSALMSGGGIGVDYSILRPSARTLSRTGGVSSGPIPFMHIVNEIGRNVMQGGSRRSAIFASLNWQHDDIRDFLHSKDWSEEMKQLKAKDFNFPLPLDMTNISVSWDTTFAQTSLGCYDGRASGANVPALWNEVVEQMCKTGEPGMCFNFYENEKETLRNACTEFTSEDDSDVCNLGSINLGNIETLDELKDVVGLAARFLVCGTLRGEVPYEKVKDVRDRNRKIGLGLMGIHEWLLKRGYAYEVVPELKEWLEVYKSESERAANEHCDRFYLSHPKKYRAIAPAGTLSILSSTSSGIEPLFAVAYKRRYLVDGTKWKYQYVVDSTAKRLIEEYGINPESIETSYSLARNPEQRIKMQHGIQSYVDMGISSTINLPEWGSEFNNEDTTRDLGEIILKYCSGLRGITCFPSGSRGFQPLTEVPYEEAIQNAGIVFAEENTCSGGICSI